MRSAIPWIAASIVLVALWPTVCMSGEGEAISCQSALLLRLPWGDNADTWGFLAAIGAAALTFIALHAVLRRGTGDDD